LLFSRRSDEYFPRRLLGFYEEICFFRLSRVFRPNFFPGLKFTSLLEKNFSPMPASRKSPIYYWFAGAFAAFIIFHFVGLLAPVEKSARVTLRPFLKLFSSLNGSLRQTFSPAELENNPTDKIKQLEEKIQGLIVENARLRALEQENNVLREHLSFFSNRAYRPIFANVIAFGENFVAPESDQIYFLDRGAKDGLRPGLVVLDSRGAVAGKILVVKDDIARVCFPTSPQCQFAAAGEGSTGTIGLAQGQLGLVTAVNFIPPGVALKTGDIIMTSGLEPGIPRGLVIGRINRLTSSSNDVWQGAEIDPLSDFNQLTIASVILP